MFTCSREFVESVLLSGWSHCYSSCTCWRWRTHHQSTALWSYLHPHWLSGCHSFAIEQHTLPPPVTEKIHRLDFVFWSKPAHRCIKIHIIFLRSNVPWVAQPCQGVFQKYHWENHQCCRCPSPALAMSICENVLSPLGARSAPEGWENKSCKKKNISIKMFETDQETPKNT